MAAMADRARDPGDPRIVVMDADGFVANWNGSVWSEGFGDVGTVEEFDEAFTPIMDTSKAESLLSAARAALSS